MAYTLRHFDTAEEMVDYLNGVIQGKALSPKVFGLHGLTLKVNPAGTLRTVTFADATGGGLLPSEIVAQMEAVHADMVGIVVLRNYRHSTPPKFYLTFHSAGDLVDKTGTANPLLGFPTAADTTVGAAAVAKADIVLTVQGPSKLTLVHE